MGNLASIKQQVQDRTGFKYSDNESMVERLINSALKEISLVNFDFLRGRAGFQVAIGSTSYPMPAVLNEYVAKEIEQIFYDSDGSEIIQDQSAKEVMKTWDTTVGTPKNYCMFGMAYSTILSKNVRAFWVGNPWPTATVNATIFFWKLLTDLNSDTDESTVSLAWSDDPIVYFASYLIYKNMELFDKANDALNDFRIEMKNMESLGFTGRSYEDIVIARQNIYHVENTVGSNV